MRDAPMSQLVLVRCPKCKRRYAKHGDGACPFCASQGGGKHRGALATPKVVVHGDALVEVVRQPARHTPPPQAGKPGASGANAAARQAIPSGEARVPEKRRAIILRPSPPIKVGPIVLPRRVWMSIVAIAIAVAGSVMAWEVTHGDNDPGVVAAPAPELPRRAVAHSDSHGAKGPAQPIPARGDGSHGGSAGAPVSTPAQATPDPVAPGAEPSTAAENFRKGTRFFMDGNLAGAQARFEAAIALDPAYCAAHRALGVVHATRQDGRRSIEAYQRYLQCSPRVADDAEIQRRIASFGGNASAAGDGQR